jgi:hypothetical protein
MANEFQIDDAVPQAFQNIINIIEAELGASDKNSAVAEKGCAQLLGDMCELTPKDVILTGGVYLVHMLKVDVSTNK